ncbi:MAG: phosphatidate cytidylyltransferase [Saccharofermentans sp.]|nr:phosphatidate cytidylyltransferase [Saccharofermentans sp.]
MRQRIITGVLFTLGVAAFVVPSLWFPLIICAMALIVGGVVVHELIKATRTGNYSPSAGLILTGFVFSFVLFAISYALKLSCEAAIALYVLVIGSYSVACGILVPVMRTYDQDALRNGLITGGIVFYVTFPLYCLCAGMNLIENGWYYMLIGLCASWISDVFAYFVGVTIGKHKLIPHISPKKTWEGFIGGAVGCAVVVALYSFLVIYRVCDINIGGVLFLVITFILGFMISLMSQLGDWFASVIKRKVGIKDYGNIFPGHGGMLDRFDSAFFTLPFGVLLAFVINLF